MGRIHVLDDLLINRIAAGEVVERPASVVKELIENSLDAGACSIEIAVEGGGRRSIRVVDDGEGMDRDDALLALERHATSKFSSASDLERIATLGFRGEALPSIAAVSRFILRSAPENGRGTEVEVHAGRIAAVRDVAAPRGTRVSVERLFANVPARRKFLRSEGTESAHVVRIVTRYALANPTIGFRLDSGARRLIAAPAVRELGDRIVQLWGKDHLERMLPFGTERGDVRVRGFAGRPVDALPRRDGQHLFVNGRVVQDRVLAHAVQEAYGNTMPRGRFPSVVLFLQVPASEVDVNVHPRKTEVRFRRSGEVHDAVRDAISAGLADAAAVPSLTDLRPSSAPRGEALPVQLRDPRPEEAFYGPGPRAPEAAPRPAPLEASEVPGAVPLGQYRDSYIVAQDEQGLLLVDQHAAHERVLFERYLEEAEDNRVEVQSLMFPPTVELAAHEALTLEQELAEFRRLGFVIEPFGGNAVRVAGVPALAARLDPGTLLRELLGEASRTRSAAAGVDTLRRKLVTTAACHAAIKVNHPLGRVAMQGLLDDLYRTVNPTTCPHGRPALFRLTLEEIERAFRRR